VTDLRPQVKEHRSRFAEKTPPQGPPERAGQFFPLGIYAGHGNLHGDALQFVVDDMVDHNCNCVYMNNSGITNLAATLDLCERAGLKIIYQGGSSGSLYYQSKGYFKGSIEKEIEFNQQNFIPSARRHVPGFRGRWGILGWSLTEEIPPDVPERMKPCYGLMRELDPTHSCVLLHNNLTAAENDLAINRPEAVTTDIYAYAMTPVSSATSHVRAKDQILSYTARYRSACDKADVPLWFMGLCASAESEENCTWPPYGMAGGWPTITAADIRFQSWLAIASGARGLFFFAYHSPYPNGTACRDAWWRESPAWKAIGEFFGDVKPITKLLLNLQVAEDDPEALKSDDPKVLVRRLVPRGDETAVKGTYAVVVNIDCTEWRAANLSGTLVPQPPAMRDLKRNRPVPPDKPLMLAPGDGTLLQLP